MDQNNQTPVPTPAAPPTEQFPPNQVTVPNIPVAQPQKTSKVIIFIILFIMLDIVLLCVYLGIAVLPKFFAK